MKEEYKGMDNELSAKEVLERAEHGSPKDMVEWAMRLKLGKGVARDKAEAVNWLKRAADLEDAEALFQLGRCAETGIGLPQDDVAACEYYHHAAMSGLAEAQYAYGVCLQGGLGCICNSMEARCWIQDAAAQGLEKAIEMLKSMDEMAPLEEVVEEEKETARWTQETITPVNPQAYTVRKEEKKIEPALVIQEASVTERSSAIFYILMMAAGIASGYVLKVSYGMIAVSESFRSVNSYMTYLMVIGVISGFILAKMTSGLYKRAKDPLPIFAFALLMPVVVFLLAMVGMTIWAIITGALKVVWSIILAILKVIFTIIIVVIVIAVVLAFLG